jgi:hypothetical protein
LRVLTQQQVKSGTEIRIKPQVVAEISQSQTSQVHARV